MHFKISISSLLILCLSGCVTNSKVDDPHYYYSNSKPIIASMTRELKRCAIEAYQQVPARTVVQSSPMISTPTRCTNFGGRVNCTGGDVYGGQMSSYDENDPLREEVRLSCLKKVDIHRTYLKYPDCPKAGFQGGFGGWLDGRLTAVELATLKVSQINDSIANHPPKTAGSHEICLVKSSLGVTHTGSSGYLNSYPEYFAELSPDHRSGLAKIFRKNHALFNSFTKSLIGPTNYNDLVAAMQLAIDYCTGDISADKFWMEAARINGEMFNDKDIKLETYSKAQVCKQGELPF